MSAKPGSGLGKGLGSLIPQDFDSSLLMDRTERVQNVFIKDIQPNPDQPRKYFDQLAINELASSIRRYGILQPLILAPAGTGYIIIAGERRWRAAKVAELSKVPAIIRQPEQLEQIEIALIENVQRVDLSPLEQAVSISRLHEEFNLSLSEIAERLGKATSTVGNILRLLQLPPDAVKALQSNQISEGHARAILALRDHPRHQAELLKQIIKHEWSVRQAEQFVVGLRDGAEDYQATRQRVANTTPETEALGKKLKTKVSVRRTAKGGRLELHFLNDDELNQLIELLSKLRR